MVDTSPSVMILPTAFFDFTREANEFYFPPLIGTYLRLLRIIVFFHLPVYHPGLVSDGQRAGAAAGVAGFSLVAGTGVPEPLSQLLVVEFLIDVLKLASLNTPDSLSNSFSMLGALILGDLRFRPVGWDRKCWYIWPLSQWPDLPSPVMNWDILSNSCGWYCC